MNEKRLVAFELATKQQKQLGTWTRRGYAPCRLGWRVHAPNGPLIRSASAAMKQSCCRVRRMLQVCQQSEEGAARPLFYET